jgi:hypothetical protein
MATSLRASPALGGMNFGLQPANKVRSVARVIIPASLFYFCKNKALRRHVIFLCIFQKMVANSRKREIFEIKMVLNIRRKMRKHF